MTDYTSARDKADAVARMYLLGGKPPQPLGPGSKEKKSAIEALGAAIELELEATSGKVACCRIIADALQVEWDETCWSAGDTVTLRGLNRLIDAVVERNAPADTLARGFFIESVVEARAATTIDDGFDYDFDFLDEEVEDLETDDALADEDDRLTPEMREVAERIKALSKKAPAAPRGIALARSEISLSGEDFESGSWRTAVAEVQGWLRLATDLDPSSDENFNASLFEGLGESGLGDGLWSPISRDETLALLNERLERAVALREAFEVEVLAADDTASAVAAASASWEQSWGDAEDETQSEVSGSIQALADIWPIADFVQHARDGELDLSPSYQRADVWPNSDAQILIESVLRGIPLPSVILLQRATGTTLQFEVVDGKQRLTSLLRFTGNHPTAVSVVSRKAERWGVPDLLHVFQTDYPRFKKMWRHFEGEALTATREREHYFPFPLRSGAVGSLSGELEGFRSRYYCELRNLPITVVGEPRTVKSLFEQTSQYKIPVILYKQVSSEQVHEVFSLYNKQGKHLNAEEIRNALYHHLALMKGLLVAAGDTHDLDGVAPFLAPIRDRVSTMGRVLGSYGFARAGFRRTKLLSWISAALLVDEGRPDARSTASHINLLFKRVDALTGDPLRDPARVRELVHILGIAIATHKGLPEDTWHSAFRNAQGYSKWQELQLVAVLIGFASAAAVHGDQLPAAADAARARLSELSASEGWQRPAKTQSKLQWVHTARIVADTLDALEIPVSVASNALFQRFGVSGLDALVAVAPRP